jgi:hypothetical protein
MDDQLMFSRLSSLPEEMKIQAAEFINSLWAKAKKDKPEKKKTPKFGSGKGMFTIMPDFDEPLEDFKEYME